jgi:hypothetical protein
VKRLLIGVVAFSAACVWVSKRVDIEQVDLGRVTTVTNAAKAHLKDGSTVVYRNGFTVAGGELRGPGTRYDLSLTSGTRVDSLPIDTIVGMESFRTRINGPESFIVSTLATIGGVFGGAALAVAIFGSCPTIYSGDGTVEEAELFSSSIAPLFEGRDLDRLRAQPDSSGVLRLDVRNEAMETHYINHLQLIEVEHAADEFVLPDAQGRPMVVGDPHVLAIVSDRAGRDEHAKVDEADGIFYETDQRRIDAATADDMDDWLDLTAAVPPGADKVALVLRARNSLLGTVLLYDVMLGPGGAAALDWMGGDLGKISTAVELGRWHTRRAGLHVLLWQDGAYREVARIPDSGPISWHDVAAVIPVRRGDVSVRLRLSFLADHWRIDRLRLADISRTPTLRTIKVEDITESDGRSAADALESLRRPDDRYLQTTPGQRFYARFDVGTRSQLRTFLLASQGYYTEWIRGTWIKQAKAAEPFVPTDEALLVALRRWSGERATFEPRFLAARVPVH